MQGDQKVVRRLGRCRRLLYTRAILGKCLMRGIALSLTNVAELSEQKPVN